MIYDELVRHRGRAVLPLLDPDKVVRDEDFYSEAARSVCPYATAFLVGGSTGVGQLETDRTVKLVKSVCDKPVIVFPGSPCQVVPSANAILFMSLLNSTNRKYLIDYQLEGALLVHRYGVEPIPTAYIIVGEGGTAGWVGEAKAIPPEKPELLAMYVLAAKYLGFKLVYLEAGSGVRRSVPPQMVGLAKKLLGDEVFLVVGGGIKDVSTAVEAVRSGADGIVIGTVLEKDPRTGVQIAKAVAEGG
ncbi:MAG: geranylgeranylglyceryl/heptaprenylglyceryl phosphate synthase [Crenarchaeota archaeon]|nr:geranylgeranylglyceryl/heptaprenylglyceryl phosphate synthase [Thermoproteota archaeon]